MGFKNYIFTIAILLITTVAFAIPKAEKNALVDLYESTNGSQWIDPWDLSSKISSWKGVVVENNHVVSITLFNNNLDGTLPKSIGNLENLRVLNLAFNNLKGAMPHGIFQLQNLKVLRLGKNKLTGSIPKEISGLSSLEYLDLFSNNISGDLPEIMGSMINLKVLSLSDNKITGKLPSSLSKLSNLERLELSDNNMGGDIPSNITELNNFPTQIIKMPNLEVLQIQNNKFNTEFLTQFEIAESKLALFDYDGNKEFTTKGNLKNLYIDKSTRTANTVYEDVQEN